jgi:hypothetical protein
MNGKKRMSGLLFMQIEWEAKVLLDFVDVKHISMSCPILP